MARNFLHSVVFPFFLLNCAVSAWASTTAVTGIYRYQSESAFVHTNGSPLDDGKAYLGDFAIGASIKVSNARDGDKWVWEFWDPEGGVNKTASLTFHTDYNGKRNCFVSYIPFYYPQAWCGITSTRHEVAYKTFCRRTGEWSVDIHHIPGDGSPEQWFENPLEVVSAGPKVSVATSQSQIRPKVIGGGGIPHLSAGTTGVRVAVNDSGCPNRPLPDAEIQIETRTVPGSGGHTHLGEQTGTGTFPSGSAVVQATADQEGLFVTEYTAGVAGLHERVIATAKANVSPEGEPARIMEGSGEALLSIAIPGLVPLTPSSDYELYQSEAGKGSHRENNYGTFGLVSILQSVATRWIQDQIAAGVPVTSVRKISYNDMSLPNGGVFELCESMKADCSHVSHEVGIDVDVNVRNRMRLSSSEAEELKSLFKQHEPSCRFIHRYHFRCETALSTY